MSLWLVPLVAAARYLRPRSHRRSTMGNLVQGSEIPAAIQVSNPFNPDKDAQIHPPRERRAKTYRGRIVYRDPPSYNKENAPNYGRQFMNVAALPGSRPVNRMRLMQQAYRMSYRQMARPWQPPNPRVLKYVMYTDDDLSTYRERGATSPGDISRPLITSKSVVKKRRFANRSDNL